MENGLKILGLSEQEIKLYLACLKLGSSKASTIASYAKIDRQASYYTLKLLIKKGLIAETIKSGVQYFSVTNPKTLSSKIDEEANIKKDAVKKIVTEYEKLKKVALPTAKVSQYEGIEGFKTIAREMLEVDDKELYSYNTEKVVEFMPLFLEPYALKRKEKKIKANVLTEKTPLLLKYKKQSKNILREIRFIDKILDRKDYSLAIAKDKVIFIRVTDKEQIGIKIEDPSFAELQKNIFNLLWKKAKK